MDGDDLALVRAQGLRGLAAAFPAEIAAAIALARQQQAALAAMPLDPADAP